MHPLQQAQESCPHLQGLQVQFSQVHPFVHWQSVHEQSVQVQALQQAVADVKAAALHPLWPCEDIWNAPPAKAIASTAMPDRSRNDIILLFMVRSFR